MENASKALLIAGGMLIAIIIVSMFMMVYNKVSNLSRSQEAKVEAEQLKEYNAQFEAFDKQVMYGADVITLANKIENNNANNINKISLQVDGTIITSGKELTETDFETLIFKCDRVEYDNNTGKVKKIYITKFE